MISHPSDARRRTMADPTMPRGPATQTRLPDSEKMGLLGIAPLVPIDVYEILPNHFGAQVLPVRLVPPTGLGVSLGRVADQQLDLGRPEIAGIDLHEDTAGFRAKAGFFDAGAAPPQGYAGLGKGLCNEITDHGGF